MSVKLAFGEEDKVFFFNADAGTPYQSEVSITLKEYLLNSIDDFNGQLKSIQRSPTYTKMLHEGRLKNDNMHFTENSVNFKKYWKIRANDNDDAIDLAMNIRLLFHLQPIWDLYNYYKTFCYFSDAFGADFKKRYTQQATQYDAFFSTYNTPIQALALETINIPFFDDCFNGTSIQYNSNEPGAYTASNIISGVNSMRTFLGSFYTLFKFSKPIVYHFPAQNVIVRSFNQKERIFFWDRKRIERDRALVLSSADGNDIKNLDRSMEEIHENSISTTGTSISTTGTSISTTGTSSSRVINDRTDVSSAPTRQSRASYTTPSCVGSRDGQNLMLYLSFALCDCVSVLSATFKDQEQFNCTENNDTQNSIYSVDIKKQRHEFDVFNTMRRLIQDFPSVFGKPEEVDPFRVCETPQYVYRFSCIPHVLTNGWIPDMDCMKCIKRQHSQQEQLKDCTSLASCNENSNTDETCNAENSINSHSERNQLDQSIVTEHLPSSSSTHCIHCLRSTYLPYGPNCKPVDLKCIEAMLSSKVIKLTKETIELFVENFYERIMHYALRMNQDTNHRDNTSKKCEILLEEGEQEGESSEQRDPSEKEASDSCDSENLDTNQRNRIIFRMQDTLQGMKTERD